MGPICGFHVGTSVIEMRWCVNMGSLRDNLEISLKSVDYKLALQA